MPVERFRAIPVVMLAAAVSLYAADKPKSANAAPVTDPYAENPAGHGVD